MVAPTAAPAPSPPNLAWRFLLDSLASADAILAAGYPLADARQALREARVLAAGLSDTPGPPAPASVEASGRAVARCRHLRVIAGPSVPS
jgi:hypothetical protein